MGFGGFCGSNVVVGSRVGRWIGLLEWMELMGDLKEGV